MKPPSKRPPSNLWSNPTPATDRQDLEELKAALAGLTVSSNQVAEWRKAAEKRVQAFKTTGSRVRSQRPLPSHDEDPVNRPSHYTRFPVEVIELTEHLNFCRGNVVKYVCRAGRKAGSDELEDLRKGLWYLQREIARLEGER